jgi:hypothetical protein
MKVDASFIKGKSELKIHESFLDINECEKESKMKNDECLMYNSDYFVGSSLREHNYEVAALISFYRFWSIPQPRINFVNHVNLIPQNYGFYFS